MAEFLERLRQKVSAMAVSPNEAHRLIHENNSGKTGDGDEKVVDQIVKQIGPSRLPAYKRARLEQSVRLLLKEYDAETLLQLDESWINSKGEIKRDLLD